MVRTRGDKEELKGFEVNVKDSESKIKRILLREEKYNNCKVIKAYHSAIKEKGSSLSAKAM